MKILNTTNITEWKDVLNSKHSLPLDIIEYNKDNFFSSVDTLVNITYPEVTFTEVKTTSYKAQFNPTQLKQGNEFFLLTYSYNQFIGNQKNNNYNFSHSSFILDLTQPFVGHYIKDGHSKALVIPFDVLPSLSVDFLRNRNLTYHPLCIAITTLLKSTNTDELDTENNYKINAIMDLLSITKIEDKSNIITDIRLFLEKNVIQNKKIDLDILAAAFYMSRRKMQYVLSEHGWTYRKLVEDIKMRYR
ncbi:hypothetical protein HGP28_02780 [Vibrio sp. SM6]|uniref:Uncharacterized protein n=1 Tax=Vibrio agarilyticus TaxID=2726741 RepID=A0A7X8YFM4_9VIBR|nr:hypothetical protein [Vibrio agarilyticus]NLS11814.1 hypothetical protein [Vibrio agarilyticus]